MNPPAGGAWSGRRAKLDEIRKLEAARDEAREEYNRALVRCKSMIEDSITLGDGNPDGVFIRSLARALLSGAIRKKTEAANRLSQAVMNGNYDDLRTTGLLLPTNQRAQQEPAPEAKAVEIPMTKVERSSSISEYGYHPESKTLRVTYASGGTWDHANVEEAKYNGLVNAPSKGQYLHANIRKLLDKDGQPQHPATKK